MDKQSATAKNYLGGTKNYLGDIKIYLGEK